MYNVQNGNKVLAPENAIIQKNIKKYKKEGLKPNEINTLINTEILANAYKKDFELKHDNFLILSNYKIIEYDIDIISIDGCLITTYTKMTQKEKKEFKNEIKYIHDVVKFILL